ncbi:MAG: hypothetical protein HXY34_07930 [Candidatus Thorarchaeota archaeon]|nr:hypothetical protein [Candidatus Thorarchaeota archaeon]
MTNALEVFDDGTTEKVDVTKASLDSTKVFCIVDSTNKSIYIWQGRNADVRRRFVGAQVATNLRSEHGLHYRVRAEIEGEETSGFLNSL